MNDINARITALRARIPRYDRFALHCEPRGADLTQAWTLGIGHKPGLFVVFPIDVRGDSIESVLEQAEALVDQLQTSPMHASRIHQMDDLFIAQR